MAWIERYHLTGVVVLAATRGVADAEGHGKGAHDNIRDFTRIGDRLVSVDEGRTTYSSTESRPTCTPPSRFPTPRAASTAPAAKDS
jgi:hypothetical protein